MRLNQIRKWIPTVVAVLCILSLIGWLLYNPVGHLAEFVPGMDNRPESMVSSSATVQIGARYAVFGGTPSAITASWPRFRGAHFDNISKESVALASDWPEGHPPELWSVELGEGHAGPVVAYGRVYVLDYDEIKRCDLLRCFSLDTGQELWQRGYDVYIKRNHGFSRTIPAIADNRVVTMGPMCQVMCVTADSGKFEWGLDLAQTYQAEVPLWYTGQCPLIDDSVAVLAVGGTKLMVGLDLYTGEVLWETPNPNQWKMSHSSIMPCTIHGQKMYVYCAIGGIVGVSAEPETVGQILFETTLFDPNVIAPSPVYLGDGKLFVTAGYGGGAAVLQIVQNQNGFSVDEIQSYKPGEGLSCEQQTPILFQNHLFGILPKDAGPLRNQFVCVNADDCTQIVWSSGTTERFGLGPYLVADNKFFILSDEGELTILEVSTNEYKQLSRSKILDGHDAWGPMAIVDGLLLARDSKKLVCLDMRVH